MFFKLKNLTIKKMKSNYKLEPQILSETKTLVFGIRTNDSRSRSQMLYICEWLCNSRSQMQSIC